MSSRVAGLLLVLVATGPAWADEFEDILLYKFGVQKQIEIERVRAVVTEAVNKAKEVKENDPDQAIEILRAATNRLDDIKLMSGIERRAMVDLVQPLVIECRDLSLAKRREKASVRFERFKDYLEVSALEGRYPGRSGPAAWEPAAFMDPDGRSRVGKLVGLNTGLVTVNYGQKDLNVAALPLPLIQVFGGLYVYDKASGHHVFLTNREFYDFLWSPLVRQYDADDVPGKKKLTAEETTRSRDDLRLNASIATGEFFLRSLPNQEPIAGVGDDESHFLNFVAQAIMQKGMPQTIDRIYPREMQDRLVGFSKMQLSAVRRSLFLLQAKDVAVSPLYIEIMRDETAKLLRSEYAGFTEGEANRANLYLFSKLK